MEKNILAALKKTKPMRKIIYGKFKNGFSQV